VFITGASSGLGLATAKLLASRGARVVIARLPIAKPGELADDQIGREVQPRSALLGLLDLDLADFASIRKCVAEYASRGYPPIDVVVLNAGLVAMATNLTRQGLESTIGVNYVGHFVLVNALLSAGLVRTDGPDPSRIIAVASEAHRIAPPLCPQELRFVRQVRLGTAITEYGISKQLVLAMMSELQRRLLAAGSNVVCMCLCPGGMATNIVPRTGVPKSLHAATRPLFYLFFKSPAKAAELVGHLAAVTVTIEDAKAVQRCLYSHVGVDKAPREDATDPALGQELWKTTE
jgi:NAD(P)-dependent dehydrogenase (short-subunit alcohol dehydrogenase family)